MKLKDIYLELDIYLNEWYRCLSMEEKSILWGEPIFLEEPTYKDFKDEYDFDCAHASWQDSIDEHELDWISDHIYNRVLTHDEMYEKCKESTKDVVYGRELGKFLESLKSN